MPKCNKVGTLRPASNNSAGLLPTIFFPVKVVMKKLGTGENFIKTFWGWLETSQHVVFNLGESFLKRFPNLKNKKHVFEVFYTFKKWNSTFLKCFTSLKNKNTFLKHFQDYKMKKHVFKTFSYLQNQKQVFQEFFFMFKIKSTFVKHFEVYKMKKKHVFHI